MEQRPAKSITRHVDEVENELVFWRELFDTAQERGCMRPRARPHLFEGDVRTPATDKIVMQIHDERATHERQRMMKGKRWLAHEVVLQQDPPSHFDIGWRDEQVDVTHRA
jgi:hypothetical protein